MSPRNATQRKATLVITTEWAWDHTNKRLGYFLRCNGIMDKTWLTADRAEAKRGLADIVNRRESLGLLTEVNSPLYK